MKALNIALLSFLLFLLASSAVVVVAQSPQSSTDPPGVSVVKKSWRRQRRNPALNEDPFRANQKQANLERARAETISENNRRASAGQNPLPLPTQDMSDSYYPGSSWVEYIYEARVQNNGDKAIRALVWDYVFFEPGTQQEIGRRQYISKVSISPGKIKSLVARSSSPPTGIITTTQAAKEFQNQYSEQVIIQSIRYADGSVWQRDSK